MFEAIFKGMVLMRDSLTEKTRVLDWWKQFNAFRAGSTLKQKIHSAIKGELLANDHLDIQDWVDNLTNKILNIIYMEAK